MTDLGQIASSLGLSNAAVSSVTISKPNLIYAPSPNRWTYNRGRRAIVLHGTSGTYDASFGWLRNPDSEASANFLVSLDGTKIACLVDPEAGFSAWANGILQAPDTSKQLIAYCINNNINPNLMTISIEHEAAASNMHAHLPAPEAQMVASLNLVRWLCYRFNIVPGIDTIMGHHFFDSRDRADCPGVISEPLYIQRLLNMNDEITVNGHILRGEIKRAWQSLGDKQLPMIGYPISEEYPEAGTGRVTQDFEKSTLQFFPEYAGTPAVVQAKFVKR